VIQRLAVVGVGLLGGSVAKAARAHGLAREIVGVGRDRARLAPALAEGVLDRAATDLAESLRDADFVLLAAPVSTIEAMLPAVAAAVAPTAVVTDVGSTKAGIARTARRLAPFPFLGSHPMAGSEQSGYGVARADLFQGSTVMVTPTEAASALLEPVTAFWEHLGASRVLALDPDAHDRAVAAISHLPHLVARALVDAVARHEPAALDVAGRGFRDTTRIAAGDVEMWAQIFLENRAELIACARTFRRALDDLLGAVGTGDAPALRAALARIKACREGLA
jgi:prephenate dehydrogenase